MVGPLEGMRFNPFGVGDIEGVLELLEFGVEGLLLDILSIGNEEFIWSVIEGIEEFTFLTNDGAIDKLGLVVSTICDG